MVRSMVRAMGEVEMIDWKEVRDLILMFGLNEAMDQWL